MPLVSVVMLSYNHEEFLSEAIESVLGQDFDDFELIIVDDGSTDSSREIIQKYAAEDPRIRVILHEVNCGIAKTANDGIAAAKGKFVAITASDDVWAKDKLTKQLAVTASNENLIVWSEGEVIDGKGQPVGKSFSEWLPASPKKKSGHIWQEILEGNYIFGTTLLFKKTNLGNIRFDENLAYWNNYKFVLDLARKYEFYYIAEPLAQYRVHERNTVAGYGAESKDRLRQAGKEYVSICEEALQRYGDEIRRKTKALMYGKMGATYYAFGDKRKGRHFFLQAVRCNPFETENLLYPPRALKHALGNLLSSRTREDLN